MSCSNRPAGSDRYIWTLALEVGHSIRTIDECIARSADVTVQTNLLEARLITGNPALFSEMQKKLTLHLDQRAFFHRQAARTGTAPHAFSGHRLQP